MSFRPVEVYLMYRRTLAWPTIASPLVTRFFWLQGAGREEGGERSDGATGAGQAGQAGSHRLHRCPAARRPAGAQARGAHPPEIPRSIWLPTTAEQQRRRAAGSGCEQGGPATLLRHLIRCSCGAYINHSQEELLLPPLQPCRYHPPRPSQATPNECTLRFQPGLSYSNLPSAGVYTTVSARAKLLQATHQCRRSPPAPACAASAPPPGCAARQTPEPS